MDPGVEIRSGIAEAARQLAPRPDDTRAVFISAIAPEDHIDELMARLTACSASPERLTGTDARRYGIAALWMGALDQAVDFFGLAIGALREEGRLGQLTRALIIRAFASVHLGTMGSVASDLDEGFRLGVETRQPFYLATADVAQAIYLAFRGDIAGGERRIQDAEQVVLSAPAHAAIAEMRHARGVIDLVAGRHAEAYVQLRRLFDRDDPSFHPIVSGWATSDFADAAVATDNGKEAEHVLRRLEADQVRMRMPWWAIGVAYGRAVLAGQAGDEAAASAFARARAQDLDRWPLARGRLALAYGTWLRRRRQVAESRIELREARDLLDGIGVRYLADRAEQELGASGESTRHRGIDVLDQLTPQELQIARLAADGLSNREIGNRLYLSHRTVASHLYRVFPKLGIRSRAQLHSALP
jgi:ATP/maltotriose-dependent transcriptional regulator MalT